MPGKKFSVTFGLVSIPVRLEPAVREDKVSFHFMTSDGHRVKQVLIDEVTGQQVDRKTLMKGYEDSKDHYIIFTQEELDNLKLKSTKTVEIIGFLPESAASEDICHKEDYYVGEEKGGEKGYSLLYAILDELKLRAVGRVVLNGKEYTVLLYPWKGILRLTVLYYPNEIQPLPAVQQVPITAKEKEMAKLLIQSLGQPDLQGLKDRYREAVRELIKARQEGKPIEGVKVEVTSPEADLAELLKKSLEAAKKQPEPVPVPLPAPKKRKDEQKQDAQ
jgi:DNA end-binding protein Ku